MNVVNLFTPVPCPLCGGDNSCTLSKRGGKIIPNNGIESKANECWCTDPNLTFPQELIELVPTELQGKACICRHCVIKFNRDGKL